MKTTRKPKRAVPQRRIASISASLDREFAWLTRILETRIRSYFEMKPFAIEEIKPPAIEAGAPPGTYEHIVSRFQMRPAERLVLALALSPALRPQSLDILFQKNPQTDRGFTEFGGIKPLSRA